MNNWKHSILDCSNTEHTAMALFCHPCLYGINKSKIEALNGEPNSSMIPGTCTYLAINIGWQLAGVMYTGLIANMIGVTPIPEVIQCAAASCGMLGTGLYAGRLRTQIREKYNINGSKCDDFFTHAMISPCALCQEANEIKHQTTVNSDYVFYSPMTVPDTETMKATN